MHDATDTDRLDAREEAERIRYLARLEAAALNTPPEGS